MKRVFPHDKHQEPIQPRMKCSSDKRESNFICDQLTSLSMLNKINFQTGSISWDDIYWMAHLRQQQGSREHRMQPESWCQ